MTTTDLPNIAILGKPGAGKTTAAEFFRDSFGYVPVHVAAAMKSAAEAIWGPEVLTDRHKLQELGKAVRAIDEDAIVNAFLRWLDTPSPTISGLRYAVDGVRYPNELWCLRERRFTTVRVVAPEELCIDRLLANGKLQDVAQLTKDIETALDGVDVDYTVHNEGDIDALHHQLLVVLNREAART